MTLPKNYRGQGEREVRNTGKASDHGSGAADGSRPLSARTEEAATRDHWRFLHRPHWFALLMFCFLLLLAIGAAADAQRIPGLQPKENIAATSLQAYLARVHAQGLGSLTTPGSIWSDTGRFARLSTDVRASRPHDLLSVVVAENLAASTDGTVKNSRTSSASSGISGLIGTLHAGNALQNLINQNSSAGLNAAGASATNSSLQTVLGGEVVDVLPNGVLVIEAARQLEFSQQTQTIVLRGLVRPEDISQGNQVLSTAISSLELEVRGKGIVNDFTHRQNALVRFIQKILVF